MTFRRNIAAIAARLGHVPALTLGLFFAFAAGLTLLLSLSGSIQQFFLAAVAGRAPDLYGTAYEASFAQWPSFWNAFAGSWDWAFFCAALFITAAAARAKDAREFVLLVCLAAFLTLLSVDIFFHGYPLDAHYLIKNAVADAVGGLILALVLLLECDVLDAIAKASRTHWLSRSAQILAALASGFVAWAAVYFVLVFLYAPTNANLVATVRPRLSGYHMPVSYAETLPPDKISDTKRFGVFEKPAHSTSDFNLTMFDSLAAANWKAMSDGPYNVSIGLVQNCRENTRRLETAFSQTFPVRLKNVRSLRLSTNKGLTWFLGNPTHDDTGFYLTNRKKGVAGDQLYPFWILKGDKKDEYEIQRLLVDSTLHYWTTHSRLSFAIAGAMYDSQKKDMIAPVNRSVEVEVNDKKYNLVLKPAFAKGGEFAGQECRKLAISPKPGRQSFALNSWQFALLVTIEAQNVGDVRSYFEHDPLTLGAADGYFSVKNLAPGGIKTFIPDGEVHSLIVNEGLAHVEVSGKEIESTPPANLFFALGKVHARIEDDATLVLDGRVGMLTIKGERRVFTKWEQLPTAERGIAYAAAGSILLYLLTRVLDLLRGNKPINWLH